MRRPIFLLASCLLVSACSLLFGTGAEQDALDAGTSPDASTEPDASAEPDGGGFTLGALTNVTTGLTDSTAPKVAWDGANYRVVWNEALGVGDSILGATMDDAVMPVVLASTTDSGPNVSAIWTGDALAVSWLEGSASQRETKFGLFNSANILEGSVTDPSNGVIGQLSRVSIATNGQQIGVAWARFVTTLEIYLGIVDASGAVVTSSIVIADGGNTPALAANESGFGLVWQGLDAGDATVFYMRLSENGQPVSGSLPVSQGLAIRPRIVAAGSDYGVAWHEVLETAGGENVFFARVADASVVGTPVQVSDGDFPATEADIVWNGAGYGIAWKELRNGRQEILFREFDPMGAPLGAEATLLSEGAGNSSAVSLAYSGSSYAVSWQKDAGSRLIQFRTVSP